jgi:hypothetical protein
MNPFNDYMTVMDKVKYSLGLYEYNKDHLSNSELELYEMPMQRAIKFYNKGLRIKDFQKLSLLWDGRTIIK